VVSAVRCQARDSAGNASPFVGFTITVKDLTPPVNDIPANQIFTAQSARGFQYFFTATATDNVDDFSAFIVACAPASGFIFPIGRNTVNCAVRDHAGNIGSASFIVQLNSPPAAEHCGSGREWQSSYWRQRFCP